MSGRREEKRNYKWWAIAAFRGAGSAGISDNVDRIRQNFFSFNFTQNEQM